MSKTNIATTSKTNIECIDFFKGIAILGIIFVHSPQHIPDLFGPLRQISYLGQMGSQLFFLLAAFTTTLSYFRRKDSLLTFYKRKWLSIAPPYYFMILFYLCLNFILKGVFGFSEVSFTQNTHPFALLSNFLFLNGIFRFGNNDVVPGGWYIGALMLFYLIYPAIIKLFDKIYQWKSQLFIWLPIISYIIAEVLEYVLSLLLPPITIFGASDIFMYEHFSIIRQIPCFVFGIVLYYHYRDGKLLPSTTKNNLLLALISVIFLLIGLYDFYIADIILGKMFSFGAFYYAAFNLIYNLWDIVGNNFFSRTCIKFGRISYSMYFVHFVFASYGTELAMFVTEKFVPNYNQTIFYILVMIIFLPLIYLSSTRFEHLSTILRTPFKGE